MLDRPHLIARLDASVRRRRAVVVQAPAGYGKTALLRAWIAGWRGGKLVWVSLGPEDNDPTVFRAHIATALTAPGAGGALAHLARVVATAPSPQITAHVLNGLVYAGEVVGVLDGYEALTVPALRRAVADLLAYAPPSFHLVLGSRTVPQDLPLAQLRVRAQLGEVTLRDLALTPAETARYAALAGVCGGDSATLYTRTLGWIAGIGMLCAGEDPAGGVYFARHIGPHLSPAMRHFLRQIAPLDVLTAEACARVTGRGDVQAVLETLESEGHFLLPLDDHRHAWRLHPMMRAWVLGWETENVMRGTRNQ